MTLSDLSNLISLKGLITVSIGSLFAVKAIHISWKVSKGNAIVNGDGNQVTIINQELDGVRRSFRLLWNLLLAVVFVTYPFVGQAYNSILAATALYGIPLSIVAFVVTIRGFGATRVWDIFYLMGVAYSCWLIFCASTFLPAAAQYASQLIDVLRAVHNYGLSTILRSTVSEQYMMAFRSGLTTLFGFTLLFLSTGYLLFGFSRHRSFDGALSHTLTYGAMATIGYFLVCGALIDPSPGRLADLAGVIISPFFN
jgi:hypothetical protein